MRNGFRRGVTAAWMATMVLLLVPLAGEAQLGGASDYTSKYCGPPEVNVTCQPGNNRTSPGGKGTGKVPHHDGAGRKWPAVSGIFWQVKGSKKARTKRGGSRNDELLGHHGNEKLIGAGGNDILWGDWDPKNNTERQRDVLRGGTGDDWLYPSHGKSQVYGGPGRDYVWAYYGRGTIDCGPGGKDVARVRIGTPWKVRNCEKIKRFCGHGEKPDGSCYKPGERPRRSSTGR